MMPPDGLTLLDEKATSEEKLCMQRWEYVRGCSQSETQKHDARSVPQGPKGAHYAQEASEANPAVGHIARGRRGGKSNAGTLSTTRQTITINKYPRD